MFSSLTVPKYRPDIDGLRAVAVLLVVGFHAFPGKLPGGFIGVDVFFVISGFLISTILFESLEKNTFSFQEFYIRRIKRIFPALLLVMFSCYLVGWFALLADEFQQLGKHLVGGATFLSNWMLWSESGYFDKAAETKPLLHLWSLAIEEQFYIVWPVLLWIAFKKKWSLLTAAGVLLGISFFLNCYWTSQSLVTGFFSPISRFWELLSGALLAKYSFRENSWKNTLSFLGVLILGIACLFIRKESQFPGFWALLPVLSALCILFAGPTAWLNRKILSSRVLVSIGLISFPLYLWHWPLLSLAQIVEETFPSVFIRLGAIGLSLLLSWITFQWIEKPIRFQSKNRFLPQFLVAGMGVVGLMGAITFLGNGFDFRFGNQSRPLRELVSHPEKRVSGIPCAKHVTELKSLSFDGLCVISKDLPPSLLVIGDSHTIQYQDAFFKMFPEESVLLLAETSCLPFATQKLETPDCQRKMEAARDVVSHHNSIKTVYLAGHWGYLISGGFDKIGPNWRLPQEPTLRSVESFKTNALQFFKSAVRPGRQIIWMKDIPDLDFDIRSCFDVRPLRLRSKVVRRDCSQRTPDFEARRAPYDLVASQILSQVPEVVFYDPAPLFCDREKCSAVQGQMPLYFNGDHLNYFGAEQVISALKMSPLPKT